MKNLITEQDIIRLIKQGTGVLSVSRDVIITPLAMDRIRERKIEISYECADSAAAGKSAAGKTAAVDLKRAVIGSDHTGVKLKETVIACLKEKSIQTIDAGTFNDSPCDYPDICENVVRNIKNGSADFGIIIDSTGAASAMAANKFEDIRAMVCYCPFSARSARVHSNANIITLGAQTLGEGSVKMILDSFISSDFAGGKYQKRLDKLKK